MGKRRRYDASDAKRVAADRLIKKVMGKGKELTPEEAAKAAKADREHKALMHSLYNRRDGSVADAILRDRGR